MDFRWDAELVDFRQEVRDLIRGEWVPPAELGEGGGQWSTPEHRAFAKKMSAKGWLGISWPKEYGGAEKPKIYEYILIEELSLAAAPDTSGGVGTIGPTLMRHGTPEQKDFYLPRITQGELEFALGYSEPDAGSDLGSLETRADEDGDEYVINGTKAWTSAARFADYIWLATRTDQNAPKHRGISLFLVPMRAPGIKVTPVAKIGDIVNSFVFFDNVRVPATALVGERNKGWYYIAEALDYERIHMFPFGPVRRSMNRLMEVAANAPQAIRWSPYWKVLRHKVAQCAIDTDVQYKFNLRVLDVEQRKLVPNIEAAQNKLFGTELQYRIAIIGAEIAGLYTQIKHGSKHAVEDGMVERRYEGARIACVAGGSSEINRTVIATRGLGLPR